LNLILKGKSMKNLMSTAAMLTAMSVGTSASAQGTGDWYASVFGGLSTGAYTIEDYDNRGDSLELSTDSSYILGGTVGRAITPDVRAELELSYADYEMDSYSFGNYSGDTDDIVEDGFTLTTTYLMGNVWYDFAAMGAGGTTRPYVGGGLGLAIVDVTFSSDELDTVNALAFQVGAGVQVPVGAGLIDVGYRFKGTAEFDPEFEGGPVFGDEFSTASHNLQVGYVMKF
jgi:hypothetical protein